MTGDTSKLSPLVKAVLQSQSLERVIDEAPRSSSFPIEQLYAIRQHQDEVVTVYVRAWLYADDAGKERLPVSIELTGDVPTYLTLGGVRIGEVFKAKQDYRLLWLRSIDDLETMDLIGSRTLLESEPSG